jgi:phosphatidylinositol-3-phosphatase
MKSSCAFLISIAWALLALQSASAQTPVVSHVFIVLEENHNYTSVIGNSSMPYLNSVANKYGLATQYYANTPPSIGNYFMLTAGQIYTNNDSYVPPSTGLNIDNVVRHLLSAGKTWKSYEESLQSVGYLSPDTAYYARRHCPLSYFSDVMGSNVQRLNLVPFTQFATDLTNHRLPNYSFITPNLINDAHNGTLAQADGWLKTHISSLIASSDFQQSGLLIIVFDESATDNTHGGGRVAMVVVSSKAKTGYKSITLYQHQSTLRLMMQALGLSSFPGAAGNAPTMMEFFK